MLIRRGASISFALHFASMSIAGIASGVWGGGGGGGITPPPQFIEFIEP